MRLSFSFISRVILPLIISFVLLYSCNTSSQKGDNYLYKFNDELSAVIYQPDKIKKLEKREFEKYKKTGDRLYLISSTYCRFFIHSGDYPNTAQIPKVYELLTLNNGRYSYITISCNFNLAYQFADISPDQSMQFLNRAIEVDEKSGKMYLLPHMYHLKGKLYYDRKDYNKAILYYNKAMESYIKRGKKEDILYVASMYSNLSMVYEKMNNIDPAIEKIHKAIDILKKKKDLNKEEKYFIQYFNGNLASYLFKKGDYRQAEALLLTKLEFCKQSSAFNNDAVMSSKGLIDIYHITGQKDKFVPIINFLASKESEVKSINYRITANEILQDYYTDVADLQNLKSVSERLEKLQDQQDTDSKDKLQKVSDELYKYVLKKTHQEYEKTITYNRYKVWTIYIIAFLIILSSVTIIIAVRKKNKKEKELLKQDIDLHREKNKNLYLNLNLKVETEKALLENLKKIRKTKNVDLEQTLKDLQLRITTLIQIDHKNNDFVNESSLENKLFIEKLSGRFPNLTDQELRLCVYFKLSLSSKKISLLEDILPESARVYKSKIKSKIGLGKEEKLEDFLNTI